MFYIESFTFSTLSSLVGHIDPAVAQQVVSVSQQTRGIQPMLIQCWSSVFDAGPTLKQHWLNASCLLCGDSAGHVLLYPHQSSLSDELVSLHTGCTVYNVTSTSTTNMYD